MTRPIQRKNKAKKASGGETIETMHNEVSWKQFTAGQLPQLLQCEATN